MTGLRWLDPGPPGLGLPGLGLPGPGVGSAIGAGTEPAASGVWPAVGLSCAALALLLWPTRPRGPVGRNRPDRPGRRVVTAPNPATRSWAGPAAVTIAAAVVAGLSWTPVAAVVVVTIGVVATVLGRGAAADRRDRRELVDLTAALRLVARELRAGASAEAAVAAALDTRSDVDTATGYRAVRRGGARERTGQILRDLAVPASGGAPVGDPSAGAPAPRRRRRRPEPVDQLVVRLLGGWRLATRTGLPLTRLVDAVVAVAEERVAALDARRAEVAGPRLSGWVLAALPAMGLLLGSGMGVDPLAVLLAPDGWGPMLLVVGTALTGAGLLWSARIVRR